MLKISKNKENLELFQQKSEIDFLRKPLMRYSSVLLKLYLYDSWNIMTVLINMGDFSV